MTKQHFNAHEEDEYLDFEELGYGAETEFGEMTQDIWFSDWEEDIETQKTIDARRRIERRRERQSLRNELDDFAPFGLGHHHW